MCGLFGVFGNFGKGFGGLFVAQPFLVTGGAFNVLGSFENIFTNLLLLLLGLRKRFAVRGCIFAESINLLGESLSLLG